MKTWKTTLAIALLSSLLACCPATETAQADIAETVAFRAVLRAREGDVLELQSNRGQRIYLHLLADTAIVAADGSRLSADALQPVAAPLALELYVRAQLQAQRWQAEEVRVLQ